MYLSYTGIYGTVLLSNGIAWYKMAVLCDITMSFLHKAITVVYISSSQLYNPPTEGGTWMGNYITYNTMGLITYQCQDISKFMMVKQPKLAALISLYPVCHLHYIIRIPSRYWTRPECWYGINHSRVWHTSPDSKVHVAYMGPTWGQQNPGGPYVGPMNLAIREVNCIGLHIFW